MFGSPSKSKSYIQIEAEKVKELCLKKIALCRKRREEGIQEYLIERTKDKNWWRSWFFLNPLTTEQVSAWLDLPGHGLCESIEWDIFTKRAYEQQEESAKAIYDLACQSMDGQVSLSRDDFKVIK